MKIRTVPQERQGTEDATRPWLGWLQQLTSLVYLIAGLFLVYQYWKHLRRQSVLVVGMMFIAYSGYRFFLVRRSIRRLNR